MSTSNLANPAAPTNFDASRRDFLKSAAVAAGAFILGTYVAFPEIASAQGGAPQGPYDPNLFLKIGADNIVTVLSKHFEMGQGVTTGLSTMVAEELGADWSTVRFEFAPADARIYNNLLFGPLMGTGGSSSMAESWEQMRKVGAAARMMFIAAAAEKWNVPGGEIVVEKSVVIHSRSGRKANLGEFGRRRDAHAGAEGRDAQTRERLESHRNETPEARHARKNHGQSSFRAGYHSSRNANNCYQTAGSVWRESGFLRRNGREKNRWRGRSGASPGRRRCSREGYVVCDTRARRTESYLGQFQRRKAFHG